jgi:hypothetical protein
MSHMISTHLYLCKHVLSEMNNHLSKINKKLKYLKPTYLSNYLDKTKQKIKQFEDVIIQKKIDQIIVEEVYL